MKVGQVLDFFIPNEGFDEDKYIIEVRHVEFLQRETVDKMCREEYRSKVIARSAEEANDAIREKDIKKCDVQYGDKHTFVDITLSWEDGLVPDYEDIQERECDDESAE